MSLPKGPTIHYHASAGELEYNKRDALCSRTEKLRTTTNKSEFVTCGRCTKALAMLKHDDPVHTDEGKWWFWTDDATEGREGPFNHEHEARQELAEWIAFAKDLRGDPQ